MTDLEKLVLSLLRSLGEVKVALESLEIQPLNSAVDGERNPHADVQNKRILAVVAHNDELDGHEEGSIFVFKPKPGTWTGFDFQHVFPIFGDFSITMAQTRRETIGLVPFAIAGNPTLDPHQTELSFTINPGQGQGLEPLTMYTRDVERLKTVLEECKRLKEIAIRHNLTHPASWHPTSIAETATIVQPTQSYSWLQPYTSNRNVSLTLPLTPSSLLDITSPLLTRLSPASAGFQEDDVSDIALIKDEWARTRAHEFTRKGTSSLRIRLGTFNVNGQFPSRDLSPWVQGHALPYSQTAHLAEKGGPEDVILPLKDISPPSTGKVAHSASEPEPSEYSAISFATNSSLSSISTISSSTTLVPTQPTPPTEPDQDPDMIVLAFQELDLSAEALLYSTGSAREDAWCMAVFAALGEKAVEYEKVRASLRYLASKQLVGMLLVIIVKKALRSCFSDVKTSTAGVGIMGVMGNKGGTAIRVSFAPPNDIANIETAGSTTLTFVGSHLAAFDEMVEKRNLDFESISKRLGFDSGIVSEDGSNVLLSVYESDALFWMVNLNYRIDLPDEDVRSILGSDRWDHKFEMLLRYDQLKNAMRTGKAFEAFSEHAITHFPTYRFSHGLATDDMGYDLKRKPAWTDRILHLSGPSAHVQQLSYTGHPEITISDHRPISADVCINVDIFDRTQYETAVRRFYRQVAKLEQSKKRPHIQLDVTTIDLGKLSYKRSVSRTFSIRNTGKIPCAYRFVPVELNAPLHPEWMHIESTTGLLLPDENATITLTGYVDNSSASRLNLGSKNIDFTLILHTVLGKDHFISVTGEYEYTCFANKLSRLTRLPGPIRALLSPEDLLPENRAINAPREIVRLVNWMMSNDVNVDGLFVSPADEDIVNTIHECLNTGDEFPFTPGPDQTKIVIAFGDTLLQLLDSLTEPVVPVSLHARCIQMTSRDEAFELLDEFPPAAVNVWISITAFLHFIIQSSKSESDMAETITTVFALVLLRDDPTSSEAPVSPLGKRSFLLYFIS